MNHDGSLYGDLIDPTPVIGAADRLVSMCRDAAHSSDIRRHDCDALHDWAIMRYEVHDDLVRKAMNALFARDCVWGVSDLDHPGLDRYAWELAVEIDDDERAPTRDRYRDGNWLYPLGSFESCGATHEVLLRWSKPLLLVRMVHFPPVPGVCVDLFEPVYVPNWRRRWQFDHRHRDDFASFMERPVEGREGRTHWDVAVEAWLHAHPEDGEEGSAREPRMGEVPDYRQLHWPDEPQEEDGLEC